MFNYKWKLLNGYPSKGITKHNKKVFTTFACGGGSSMGYKLAGYNVVAANDIDPKIAKVYKENHNPKYFFECGIKDLLNKEPPKELYDIDVLDGSPPCSVFSISGKREKKWGKKHAFREGQAVQVLDDLFFQFIELAEKLKPKIIIAENVKGLILGNAKGYVTEINKQLNKIGYDVQIFLLNAATMGVPQKRERIFFLCKRKDLNLPKININFNERPILFKEIDDGIISNPIKLRNCDDKYWDLCKPGKSISSVEPNGNFFNSIKVSPTKVVNTLASGTTLNHYKQKRQLSKKELIKISSFPEDYNFLNIKPKYLMGMSVPPIMMARISNEVYKQWLSKI